MVMPVSSTKTRSLGSICRIRSQRPPVPLGCRCGPARWRAASFFTPQPKPPQGAAQRRPAYSRPPGARRQLLSVFVQRTIVPLPHQRPQDRLARRIDPQRATAGMRLGTASAFGARLLAPQVHRRETDAKAPGDDGRRQTSFPSQQHPLAQVGRIGLGHPRLLSSEMPSFYPRSQRGIGAYQPCAKRTESEKPAKLAYNRVMVPDALHRVQFPARAAGAVLIPLPN